MRFLADEHISRRIIEVLRASGHDVAAAAESFQGFPDEKLAELARSQSRIVITEDTDFGELAVRHGIELPGVILIDLPRLKPMQVAARVLAVVQAHEAALSGALIVVEYARIRRRGLANH